MPSKHTHTPATPTRSLAPPRQGSLRHMPRPPMCPLYARTWHPAGLVVPTTVPCRTDFRKEIEIRRAADTNPGGRQDPSSQVAGLPTSQGLPECLLRGDGECPARTAWFGRGLGPSVLSRAHWLPPRGPPPRLLQWLRKTSPMAEGLKSRHRSGGCGSAAGASSRTPEVLDCWSGHTPRFRSPVGARVRGN